MDFPWQETKTFTGFHGWPCEDYFFEAAFLECLDGHGGCAKGFTCACRTQAKGKGVTSDGGHVLALRLVSCAD